ncbi:MAG: MBL fold metallo-hydrolase [Dysgonomonas sp.]|nr:MBL fold metallo-hydrolase [Dysgonomonas sp.]
MRKKTRSKFKRIMFIILAIIAALIVAVIIFTNQSNFGKTPQGERLDRVKKSVNYKDGKFQNLHETPQLTSDKGFAMILLDFLFKKKDRLEPVTELPTVKTDLKTLDRSSDVLIWFGHSSYLMQVDSIRILVDPVLSGAASPVSFVNKPFKGADIYKPEDIPEVDYLLISHDHWDHLDYKTVMNLKDRVGKVICSLGVGEHFEYWGFEKSNIIELDWNESADLGNDFNIHCLPARHFSGRGVSPNQSIWSSFLFETPSRKIYVGGDSGYDTHFADIGSRFPDIDLAILENGQYDKDWKYIHLLPEQIPQAFKDLRAKKLFTVHHSKFALGNHPWDEPLKKITTSAERDSIDLIQPMIGEVVNLNDSTYTINKWWEGIN